MSMSTAAAVANPKATRKGTATEALTAYLATTAPAADLASLIKPRNTGRALPVSGGTDLDFHKAPSTKPTTAATASVAIGWSLTDLSTAPLMLPATS